MKDTYSFIFSSFSDFCKFIFAGFTIFSALIAILLIFAKFSLPVIIGGVVLYLSIIAFMVWRESKKNQAKLEDERYQSWVESKMNMKSAEYEESNGVRYTRIK